MKKIVVAVLLLVLASCSMMAQAFVSTNGTTLLKDGQPYYFIGTNFWYGPILGSEGQGGNRDRLIRELDSLKSCGIDNLRILVGADAGSKHANSLHPCLQTAPGMLNDTLLAGLDYLRREMEKREMLAVLYLNNAWDWSGGYGYYLKQIGYPDSPAAQGDGYAQYVKYAANFSREPKAIALFHDFVKQIVTRTNRYSGKAYKDDPTIMAWQICNEPRPFASDNKEEFYKWIASTANLIKKLDPNHLVSTGSEGLYGCESDESLCLRIHHLLSIDYLTVHVWPLNWGWSSRDRLFDALPNVYVKSNEYLSTHVRMAERIGKPMVIEEFGYSRDQNLYGPSSSTMARDAFYGFIFSQIVESRKTNGPIAGCNFWGWGGEGRPESQTWKIGDDFLGDPPHEPQGWYSVYDSDTTTLQTIKDAVRQIHE